MPGFLERDGFVVRRGLFVELGGFDEAFAPAYYEETDLCMRLREWGCRVVYEPDAVVLHYEFASAPSADRAMELQRINRETFAAKHRDDLVWRAAAAYEVARSQGDDIFMRPVAGPPPR